MKETITNGKQAAIEKEVLILFMQKKSKE